MTKPDRISGGKYRNVKTVRNGMVFDSKLEARRYGELLLLEAGGAIEHLERQVRVPLDVNGSKVCAWIVDFEYWDKGRGALVWEDVKGMITRDAAIKLKLAKALYPEVLVEIWKG